MSKQVEYRLDIITNEFKNQSEYRLIAPDETEIGKFRRNNSFLKKILNFLLRIKLANTYQFFGMHADLLFDYKKIAKDKREWIDVKNNSTQLIAVRKVNGDKVITWNNEHNYSMETHLQTNLDMYQDRIKIGSIIEEHSRLNLATSLLQVAFQMNERNDDLAQQIALIYMNECLKEY